MDALSEILRSARLTGGVFLRGEFTEPWCLSSAIQASDCSAYLGPTDHLVIYHYVLDGQLTIALPGEGPERFGPGEAAIFPRNDLHELSGRETAAAVSAREVVQFPEPGDLMVIEHGGGGTRTNILCGFLGGPNLAGDPMFAALPALIRYDCASARTGDLVRASLALAAKEIADNRAGTEAMLARISELIFVEAVRSYVESLPAELAGLFAALQDPLLSKAAALLHRDPAQQWTVADLARMAGTSRTVLAEKFQRHLDSAPMEYLTQHRMRLAARQLATGNTGIMGIAETVGYGSEAAFSRAFKRVYAVSPSEWRRQNRHSQPDTAARDAAANKQP